MKWFTNQIAEFTVLRNELLIKLNNLALQEAMGPVNLQIISIYDPIFPYPLLCSSADHNLFPHTYFQSGTILIFINGVPRLNLQESWLNTDYKFKTSQIPKHFSGKENYHFHTWILISKAAR